MGNEQNKSQKKHVENMMQNPECQTPKNAVSKKKINDSCVRTQVSRLVWPKGPNLKITLNELDAVKLREDENGLIQVAVPKR